MEPQGPPQVSDEVLAVAAVVGDLEAFGELVRRYHRAVMRIAGSIAGSEYAEDIAQDTFLLAFKALPDLDEPERFAAWLSAIARNRSLRWVRQEARLQRVEFDETLIGYLERAKATGEREKVAAGELVAQLDALPEEIRLVMRMRWMDEMPMDQIARFTGLPLSTVKWRLFAGRKKLRQESKSWNETLK